MRDDQYGYDASGNVTSIDDLLPSNVSKRAMTYDGLDRLKTVTAPNMWGTATYGYDALDNLTSTTITVGITARNTLHNINPTTNRLDSITNGPPGFNVSYGYDNRGNVTLRNGQVFEYDLAGRLKRAVGRATYTYDGFKRRVSVVGTDGVTRVQVYAQDGKLLYVAPSGGTPTKYVYMRNHVLAEVSGSTVTYNHTDAQGSPVAQTNASGAILSRTRYEPYGYIVAGTPRTIGFTGHVNDNDTGLVYMQQRYYDAFAGRFLGVDPMVTDMNDGNGFNRFSYARQNPFGFVDSDGREDTPVPTVIVTGQRLPPPPPPPPSSPPLDPPIPQRDPSMRPASTIDFPWDSMWLTVKDCANDQFGIDDLAALGAVASGWPIPGTKPFVTPGSSRGTSVAGMAADKIFGRTRFPVRMPTIVGGPGTGRVLAIAGTKSVARFVGRAVPVLGWGILAYDGIMIGKCLADGG